MKAEPQALTGSDRRQPEAGGFELFSIANQSLQLKTILVPIDFSQGAEAALRYAVAFARCFNARLVLLHVLPMHYAADWVPDVPCYDPCIDEGLLKDSDDRLATIVRESVPGGIPATTETRYGAPSIEIVNAAKESRADLIIMSTHGRTGRVHAFLGSVSSDVTRLAPCGVLVVRPKMGLASKPAQSP